MVDVEGLCGYERKENEKEKEYGCVHRWYRSIGALGALGARVRYLAR